MVQIQAINASETGEFFIKFESDDLNPNPSIRDRNSYNFYGQCINKFEAYRRYGNLPHNDILGNKLINVLGRNLLNLEKEKLELDVKYGNKSISADRRNEIESSAFLERDCNAFYVSVLAELSCLEQDRFGVDPSHVTQSTKKIANDDMKNPHGQLVTKIEKMYTDRLTKITQEINTLGTTQADKIKRQRLESLKAEITKNQTATKSALNAHLINLGITDEAKKGVFEPWHLQSIYRQVMEDFASEQRVISSFQHRSDRLLDFANESLTEAYQDAAYAMENHVFSQQRPTNEQLWIQTPEIDASTGLPKPIVIDSRQQPSLRRHDALFAAVLLRESEAPTSTNNFSQTLDVTARAGIATAKGPSQETLEAYETDKDAIQNTSKTNKANKQANTKTYQYLSLEEAQKNLEKVTKKNEKLSPIDMSMINQIKIGTGQVVQKAISSTDPDLIFCKDAQKLQRETPVHLHELNDIFAAMGFACMDFGKYFEHEMSAKSPVKTGILFILVAGTMGSASLAAGGSAMGKVAFNELAKMLTMKGGIGISPDQLQQAVNAVNNEWLKLTWSQDGGMMRELIMTAFAAPKLNYVFVDTILNNSEHKDTITKIAQRIASQDTGYTTSAEEAQQIARNIMVATLLFGSAIALGIFAHYLTVITPAQTQSLGLGAGTASHMNEIGHMLAIFAEGNPAIYTNLALTQSALAEFQAVVSALLTVKSAGLFLGKAYLVLSHMGDKVDENEKSAFMLMYALKELYEAEERIDISNPTFPKYRAQFQVLLARDMSGMNGFLRESEIQQLFGDEFLEKMGIASSTPAATNPLTTVYNGASSLARGFVKGVTFIGSNLGRKVLLPMAQVAVGIPYSLVGWYIHPGQDPYGLKTAVKSFYLGGLSVGIMFWSAIKTTANSAWGTTQRVIQEAINITAGVVSTGNYILQKLLAGDYKAAGRGVFYGASKILMPVVSVAASLVNFVSKGLDGLVNITTRVAAAAVAVAVAIPVVLIAAVIGYWKGTGVAASVTSAMNALVDNVKEPATLPAAGLAALAAGGAGIYGYFSNNNSPTAGRTAANEMFPKAKAALASFRLSMLLRAPIALVGLLTTTVYKTAVSGNVTDSWNRAVKGTGQFMQDSLSIKDNIADELHSINHDHIDKVPGAAAINQGRDRLIKWTGAAFDGVKKVFATPIYVLRTVLFRSVQEGIQQVNYTEKLQERITLEQSLATSNNKLGMGGKVPQPASTTSSSSPAAPVSSPTPAPGSDNVSDAYGTTMRNV